MKQLQSYIYYTGILILLLFSAGCLNPVDSNGPDSSAPEPGLEEQHTTYSLGIQIKVPNGDSGAKGLGVSKVYVTIKQNYEVFKTLNLVYDAAINAFAGKVDGMLPGEYFLMGEAKDSSGNVIYSGQQVITVTDSSVSCKLSLIAESGAVKINVSWPIPGYVDTLKAYATRSGFTSIGSEHKTVDLNTTSTGLYVLNLTQGQWKFLVRGYKGDELYFENQFYHTVSTNRVSEENTTLDFKKITTVKYSDTNITGYPATINLSCDTPGVTIYYKLSYTSMPSNPSTSSSRYTD